MSQKSEDLVWTSLRKKTPLPFLDSYHISSVLIPQTGHCTTEPDTSQSFHYKVTKSGQNVTPGVFALLLSLIVQTVNTSQYTAQYLKHNVRHICVWPADLQSIIIEIFYVGSYTAVICSTFSMLDAQLCFHPQCVPDREHSLCQS
jgi:hypothetical protein